jgi:retron-type reverse transcriptase
VFIKQSARIAGRAQAFWAEAKNGATRSWPCFLTSLIGLRGIEETGQITTALPPGFISGVGLFIFMFQQLTSWDNLLLAYRKASKGKRGRPDAAIFEYRLEENLLQLQAELRAKTYSPGAYTSFYIHEPKRRLISAAPFRDRVVHHALCNLIEPIFERSFIDDSYANRIGQGTHRALDRCQHFARRYRYVLPCDIEQFFPAIDHAIHRDILARKITDPDVLWLIDQILASGQGVLSETYAMRWFPGDDLWAITRPRGLPIGNLTSQFWANCYLNSFDHFVKRELRCKGYLRYVDDFLLFADDKHTLWQWRAAIIERLATLRLTLHSTTHPRPVTEGISFLGFIIFPQCRRLKRRKGIYYRRKLNKLLAAYSTGEISLLPVSASVQGWVNYIRYANTIGLRKAVLASPISPQTVPSEYPLAAGLCR